MTSRLANLSVILLFLGETAPISTTLSADERPGKSGVGSLLNVENLFGGLGLLLLAIGACWALFFNELRGEWAVNAQYNYGYVVPLLGLALFWRRWPERPDASPSRGGGLAGLISAGLLFLVLPFQIVLEANPEWRMIYWINGL